MSSSGTFRDGRRAGPGDGSCAKPATSFPWSITFSREARYIHLIRDGRDVAFSDHHAPDKAFWRKVYFNTDRIRDLAGVCR